MSINDATPLDWDRLRTAYPPLEVETVSGDALVLKQQAEQRERLKEKWSRWCVSSEEINDMMPDTPIKKKEDVVNSPSHYNTGGVEAIQAIEASMSKEAFQGYLKGNCMKYIWRMSYKGKAKEDTLKAQWYLNRLLETL